MMDEIITITPAEPTISFTALLHPEEAMTEISVKTKIKSNLFFLMIFFDFSINDILHP